LRKLSDKEILDRIPIKQNGWSESDVFLWFARSVEREIEIQFKGIAKPIKAAIKAANATHQQWALSQGITPKTVCELIKEEAIVVDTVVYRKTKYRVEK